MYDIKSIKPLAGEVNPPDTTNYNLIIPSKNDICKASDLENNFTILDTELKNTNNKINNHYHSVNDITGALPIANGGTGATTKSAAVNNLCEVGNWTPRLMNEEGSAPTYTTGWIYAMYIKIGMLIFVTADMAIGISKKGGNYAKVSGLPYTCGSMPWGLSSIEMYEVVGEVSQDIMPTVRVMPNSKDIRILSSNGSMSCNWKTNTSAGTNIGRLRLSGFYAIDI